MSDATPRLRMFAGPNGSGKTTVKNTLVPSAWFGIYINPDDLEATIRETGLLPLEPFDLTVTTEEIQGYFASSKFLRAQHLHDAAREIECRGNCVDFQPLGVQLVLCFGACRLPAEKGVGCVAVVYVRNGDVRTLTRLKPPNSTVLEGFRTYLYYIATEDPAINIQRVKNRVAEGGHDVPETNIVARYHRSLGLLAEAIRYTNRAFFFDTSQAEAWYFAEATDGTRIDLKSDEIPNRFQPIWDQFGTDTIMKFTSDPLVAALPAPPHDGRLFRSGRTDSQPKIASASATFIGRDRKSKSAFAPYLQKKRRELGSGGGPTQPQNGGWAGGAARLAERGFGTARSCLTATAGPIVCTHRFSAPIWAAFSAVLNAAASRRRARILEPIQNGIFRPTEHCPIDRGSPELRNIAAAAPRPMPPANAQNPATAVALKGPQNRKCRISRGKPPPKPNIRNIIGRWEVVIGGASSQGLQS